MVCGVEATCMERNAVDESRGPGLTVPSPVKAVSLGVTVSMKPKQVIKKQPGISGPFFEESCARFISG
jgi:hypothetical protein